MAFGLALMSPTTLSDLFPEEEASHFREQLLPRWEELILKARQQRPQDGSTEESSLLCDFVRVAVRTTAALGGRWLEAVRQGAAGSLRQLFQCGDDSKRDPESRFSLRQLEYAVHFFAEMQELVALELDDVPVDALMEALAADPADVLADPDQKTACRWQLDLVVALDSIDAELSELQFWTKRAVIGSRQVRAMLERDGGVGIRAARARLRAKRAWDDWGTEDIQREVGPWPE